MSEQLLDLFIINRAGTQYLDKSLCSLASLDYSPCRLTLLDSRGEIEPGDLEKRYPGVELVRLPGGISHAAVLNRALEMARGEAAFIGFIDSAVEVEPGWARELVGASLSLGNRCVPVPVLLWGGDPHIIYSLGIGLGRGGRIWESLRGRVDSAVPPGEETVFPHWGASLFPKGLINETGRFDKHFGIHYDMVDYCLRAAKAGYLPLGVSMARAYHRNPVSLYECLPRSSYLINQARLMLKHYPPRQAMRGVAGLIGMILFDREGKRMAGANVPDRFCRVRALAGIALSIPPALAYRLACLLRHAPRSLHRRDCSAAAPDMMGKVLPPDLPPREAPARALMAVSDGSLGRGWYELRTDRIGGLCSVRYRWMSKEATVYLNAEGDGPQLLQICLSAPPRSDGGNSLTAYRGGKRQGTFDIVAPGWETYHLPVDPGRGVVEIMLEAKRVFPSRITGCYEDVSFMVSEISLLEKDSPFLRPINQFASLTDLCINSRPKGANL